MPTGFEECVVAKTAACAAESVVGCALAATPLAPAVPLLAVGLGLLAILAGSSRRDDDDDDD